MGALASDGLAIRDRRERMVGQALDLLALQAIGAVAGVTLDLAGVALVA
jgi:hypothetical protein